MHLSCLSLLMVLLFSVLAGPGQYLPSSICVCVQLAELLQPALCCWHLLVYAGTKEPSESKDTSGFRQGSEVGWGRKEGC